MEKIRCSSCHKSWYISKEDFYKIAVCPFCRKSLKVPVQEIKDLGQAIYVCIKQNGIKVLNTPEKFYELTRQLFPEGVKEISILSQALISEDIDLIRRAFKEEKEKEILYGIGIRLVENGGVSIPMAEKYCEYFLCAVRDYKSMWKDAEETYEAEIKDVNEQYKMGIKYLNGVGVPKSAQEAARWFRKAAEQGHVISQYDLGLMYRQGKGVMQSYKKAVQWLEKAANQGNTDAQYTLGYMLEHGDGIAKSPQEAAKWYMEAAKRGNAKAQYNLGLLYEKGEGVPQSYQLAVCCYKEAAKQHHINAIHKMIDMYNDGK